MERARFEGLVAEALDGIPDEIGGWQRRKVVTTIQPARESFGNSLA